MFACFEPVMSTLVRGFANLIWRRYQGIDSYSRIGTFFLLLLGASGPQLGRVWEQAGDHLLVGAVDIVRKKFTCSFLVTLFDCRKQFEVDLIRDLQVTADVQEMKMGRDPQPKVSNDFKRDRIIRLLVD